MNEAKKINFIFKALGNLLDVIKRQSHEKFLKTARSGDIFIDLSNRQFHLCLEIYERKKMAVGDISLFMNISPPSASVMIDKLVKEGIFIRRTSTSDRRKVDISLSPEAYSDIKLMFTYMEESLRTIAGKTDIDAIDRWYETMVRMNEVVTKKL
jgi:DNA-binding MarR family transcriptional regulator